MTEQEWLECADPMPMLEFLRGKVSDRKLRLFAVACCRRVWHLLTDDGSRRAVEVAEGFIERQISQEEVFAAQDEAYKVTFSKRDKGVYKYRSAAVTVFNLLEWWHLPDIEIDTVWKVAISACATEGRTPGRSNHPLIRSQQAMVLRDIFGNSFRPITVDLAWLTSTVVSLATTLYDERAFDRMPILADALEDAGCNNADILTHCRQPGDHVRGCWAVDLVLARK